MRLGASCSAFSRAWMPSSARRAVVGGLKAVFQHRGDVLIVVNDQNFSFHVLPSSPIPPIDVQLSILPSREGPTQSGASDRSRSTCAAFARRLGHCLHFAHFGGIEQEGARSRSFGGPIEGFVVVLRVEDGFLLLLCRAERAHHNC